MDTYYIYLVCFDGSGYYTGTILTSSDREVCVHPSKYRARRFDDFDKALTEAKRLKAQFSCIKYSKVIKQ